MKKVLLVFKSAPKILFLYVLFLRCEAVSGQTNENTFNNLNLAVTTNPMLIAQTSKPNLQASISWKGIGLSINGSYLAASSTASGFTNQHTEFGVVPSLKIFPFSAVFNCLHRSLFKQNSWTPCYSFEKIREYANRPNGPYLTAGYSFEKLRYNYLPDTSVYSLANSHRFAVKNNGVQLEAGYQVTTKWLSVGLGYRLLITIPLVEGNFNPFGSALYSKTYPFNYRIQQEFVLQIGFNLSL